VATVGAPRAAAWADLLEETRRARREAPLAARIASWDELPPALAAPSGEGAFRPLSPRDPEGRVRLPALRPRAPAIPLPRFVGDPLAVSQPPGRCDLGRTALGLSPADRTLLDLIGRHPFLTPSDQATLLGWRADWARQRRDRLVRFGLVRLVDADEVGAAAAEFELAELTPAGLAILAAQQGLPPAVAVRAGGLAGGGPERPFGARRKLVSHLAHTRGSDRVFVRLVAAARRTDDPDGGLLMWRSAAVCSRGRLRPDGYGVYRHAGQLHGFFLEYDRGTASARDYRQKFDAYFAYRDSGRYARDYDGFPTVLVVTNGPGPEERIARALRAMGVGRQSPLPVLLTTEGRIDACVGGPLGPIWRDPWSTDRRVWPERRLTRPDARPPG
jgi:hypothetical protein